MRKENYKKDGGMTVIRKFVNNKYQETLYYLLGAIFTTGCEFWWTYPQVAIGATLFAIDTTMQLIYRDKKTEKKYDKFWNVAIIVTFIALAIWSFYHWNAPIMRDPLF